MWPARSRSAALREIIATGPSLLKARAAWLGGAEIGSRATSHLRTAWLKSTALRVCVRTHRLQNESRRACPELVERGRLNLAHDAVLGRDQETTSPVGTTGNHPDASITPAIACVTQAA